MNCLSCGKPSALLTCAACEAGLANVLATEDLRQQRCLKFLTTDNGFVAGFKMIGQNTYSAVVPLLYGGRLIVGQVDDPYGYDDGWDYPSVAAALEAWEAWNGGGEPANHTRRLPKPLSQSTNSVFGGEEP